MAWWSKFSPELLKATEDRLVELSGVPVTRQHVKLTKTLQLFTLRVGDPTKPIMLILHGYCGSSLVFFKTFKALAEHYYVIAVDLLGMGRSSRPQFEHTHLDMAERFFVDSLEAFCQVEGLHQFVLAGHSFGGYVAGCYTLQYPERVQKLLFLSAVGIPETPAKYDYFQSLAEKNWSLRWLTKFVVFFWVRHITPLALFRKAGPLATQFIGFLTTHRTAGLTEEETELVTVYLQQLNLLHESGELGLAYLLRPGAWAISPLARRMKNLDVPIAFFFGDRDWVTREGIDVVAASNQRQVLTKVIEDAGHHFYFDNPVMLADEMLKALQELD